MVLECDTECDADDGAYVDADADAVADDDDGADADSALLMISYLG